MTLKFLQDAPLSMITESERQVSIEQVTTQMWMALKVNSWTLSTQWSKRLSWWELQIPVREKVNLIPIRVERMITAQLHQPWYILGGLNGDLKTWSS
jgi:hypothetical protein